MIIIETSVFTQRIRELISDEEYWLLQNYLIAKPEAGKIIPGSGGFAKSSLVQLGTWKERRASDHLLLVSLLG
jgi:hypothetical protein